MFADNLKPGERLQALLLIAGPNFVRLLVKAGSSLRFGFTIFATLMRANCYELGYTPRS
jgi:hypothetical protein